MKLTHPVWKRPLSPLLPCFLLPGNKSDTVSVCSSWLAAYRVTVSSVISPKRGMQLKWQVAASSCYNNWKEMHGVTSSGTATAAQCPSPERTCSTSGGLSCSIDLFNLQINLKVQSQKQWGFLEFTQFKDWKNLLNWNRIQVMSSPSIYHTQPERKHENIFISPQPHWSAFNQPINVSESNLVSCFLGPHEEDMLF